MSIHINNPLVSESFDQLAEQKVTEGLPGNGTGARFQKDSLGTRGIAKAPMPDARPAHYLFGSHFQG
jgi:hypothetical protein